MDIIYIVITCVLVAANQKDITTKAKSNVLLRSVIQGSFVFTALVLTFQFSQISTVIVVGGEIYASIYLMFLTYVWIYTENPFPYKLVKA